MRLWHWRLIPVLPRQQLLGQWRECCLIAKNLKEKGSPMHILVNKVTDYSKAHFISYSRMIFDEMNRRDYSVHSTAFTQHISEPFVSMIPPEQLFPGWHNDQYFTECYYNLEEKYNCGGITDEEWSKIINIRSQLS